MRDFFANRRLPQHGCSPPTSRYRDTDGGRWTCPVCDSEWTVSDILWRVPGSHDPWRPSREMPSYYRESHLARRFAWRLVKSGKRKDSSPQGDPFPDQQHFRVQFMVICMPGKDIAIDYIVGKSAFDTTLRGGHFSKTVVAAAGQSLVLRAFAMSSVKPPNSMMVRIAVNGQVAASAEVKKPAREVVIRHRLPLPKKKDQ